MPCGRWGELQLKGDEFMSAAVVASPVWLSQCNETELKQAAAACAQLQYQDEHFMGQLLQRADRMLQPNWRSRARRPMSDANRDSVSAMCSLSVVQLDMRRLAGQARKLVVDSNIKQHGRNHPSNLRRLWVFHSWLLEHLCTNCFMGKAWQGWSLSSSCSRGQRRRQHGGTRHGCNRLTDVRVHLHVVLLDFSCTPGFGCVGCMGFVRTFQ